MSLNFDYSKVTKGWQDQTQSVIYLTMAVGMPKITADNVVKFASRVEMLKSGFRLVAEKGKEEPNTTLQVIENHIGLSTNANRYTNAQFRKRALAVFSNKWDYELLMWEIKFKTQAGKLPVTAVEPVEADENVNEPQGDCECGRSTGADDNGDCCYCGGANPPECD